METPQIEPTEKDANALFDEVYPMQIRLHKLGKDEELKVISAEFAAKLRADILKGNAKEGMLVLATEFHGKVSALLERSEAEAGKSDSSSEAA